MSRKICLLGDLHIGARKSSQNFMNLQERFFSFLFSELEARDIDTIIQLGDVFDSHATVNLVSLNFFKKKFADELVKRKITMVALVGNHDIAFKKTLSVNAIDQTLRSYKPSILAVSKPTQIKIKESEILFVPWICEENENQVASAVELTSAKYCVGHFEFKDFYMYKGLKNENGRDASQYSKFDHVFSGHYHHRNQHGNITYTGTPYELTWSDVNDPKGFTVLDLDSGIAEFVESPHTMFKKVYAASESDVDDLLQDKSFENHYVKLYVSCETIDKKISEKLKTHIESCGCYDLEVIDVRETILTDAGEELDLETVELKDSKSILDLHIEKLETNVDKVPLKQLMYSLYTEAIDKEEF